MEFFKMGLSDRGAKCPEMAVLAMFFLEACDTQAFCHPHYDFEKYQPLSYSAVHYVIGWNFQIHCLCLTNEILAVSFQKSNGLFKNPLFFFLTRSYDVAIS